jgi:hypothetical protein
VPSIFHHRGGGLVAGGLKGQNLHGPPPLPSSPGQRKTPGS